MIFETALAATMLVGWVAILIGWTISSLCTKS